jgi:HPt (histidine-containing phosphotransfer) domain-containing protein
MQTELPRDSGVGGIRVEVDPDLLDLVPGFLENRRADLDSIRTALERGDYRGIHRIGHNLKGDSGALGFDGLGVVGRELERAAVEHDDADIRAELGRLADYLERVEVVPGEPDPD